MKLFQRRFNYVGSWHFYDTEDISSDSSEFYYSDFYNDLLLLLTLLEKHQLLTPKFIGMGNQEPLEIVATKVEDIVKEIKQHGDLGELYLYGNTIIFTELGQEKYDYLCSVDMRFHEKNIVFRTKSDIWLPITVDEDYTYTWNLEHYQLNYHRLETALNDIKTTFKWKENSDKEYEHESGCIHLGYKFFLSERIITREYNENPKSGFSLEEYLQQISDARESQADEFYGNKGFDSHEELMNPYRPSIQIENKIINFLFNEGTNIWQTKTIIDNNEIEIEINFKFHNQKEVDWEHFKNFFNFIDQADRLNEIVRDSQKLINELGRAFFRLCSTETTESWKMEFSNAIFYNGKVDEIYNYSYSLIFYFNDNLDGDDYGLYLVDVENLAIVGARRIQC